jgi:hypothetical protein
MRTRLFNCYTTENIPSPLQENNPLHFHEDIIILVPIGLDLSFELQLLYNTDINIMRSNKNIEKYK